MTAPVESSLLEVCTKPVCQRVVRPSVSELVVMSPEITMHTHVVMLRIWTDGRLIGEFNKTCPAVPLCDRVHCTFCWDNLANPECSPWAATMAIVTLIALSLAIIVLIVFGIWTTVKTIKFMSQLKQRDDRKAHQKHGKSRLRHLQVDRMRWRQALQPTQKPFW